MKMRKNDTKADENSTDDSEDEEEDASEPFLDGEEPLSKCCENCLQKQCDAMPEKNCWILYWFPVPTYEN